MGWGNLGAGLAAVYPGVVAGRGAEAETLLKEMTAQQAQENQQSDVLRGNALMNLFAGPGGGGAPPMQAPMPGQSSQPMQPGPAAQPMSTAGAPQPLGPMDSQPGPVTAPQNVSRPFNPAQPATPSGGGGQNDPATGQPVGGGGEPQLNGVGEQGGRPTIHGGVPNGMQLTWQMVGSAIARSNPGAPPQLIAKAIDRFVPMMTQESQMQWRMMMEAGKNNRLETTERGRGERQQTREAGLNTRQELGLEQRQSESEARTERTVLTNENRLHINGLSTQSRELIAKLRDEGTNTRLFDTLKQKDDWKHLDADTKEKVAGWIIEGQNTRNQNTVEGANVRNQNSVAGANQRNQATVEGAAARNQNTTQTALEVSRNRVDLAKWLADGKPVTRTQADLSKQGTQYASAAQTIVDTLDAIQNGYAEGRNIVGGEGKIRGINEILGNVAGWRDTTARAEFVQKINLLRATLPRLLTGSAISSKDERARMADILQGLELGSTRQATAADLKYLHQKLIDLAPKMAPNMNQGDIRATRPGATQATAPAAGGAALKPMTAEQKAVLDKYVAEGHPRAELEKQMRDGGIDPGNSATVAPEPPAAKTTRDARVTSEDDNEEFDKFMERMAEISSKVDKKAFDAWLETAPVGNVEDRRQPKPIKPRATFREDARS